MREVTNTFLVTPRHVWLASNKRTFAIGFLNGYGGGVKFGEMITQTAIREIKEESTVDVQLQDLVHIITLDFFREHERRFRCHVFLATRWSGTPQETDEKSAPEQHRRSNLPLDRMLPGDKHWLPHVMEGIKIPDGAFIRYDLSMTKVINYYLPSFR